MENKENNKKSKRFLLAKYLRLKMISDGEDEKITKEINEIKLSLKEMDIDEDEILQLAKEEVLR
ncbi:MAG: hypothetical protein QY321_00110 [Patescibacteria group bacterium]|nr:MAG: hypothetical protein QY321_04365 [Patescibacteria group bacterium]WKZ24829.1 MAG: hypothetical protein QY321_00110 [Patescibacteria group bacterium]